MLELKITFDPQNQSIKVEFDPAQITKWEMVLMMLEGAKNDVEFKMNVARMTAMQQVQMQAMQDEQIKRALSAKNGGRILQ